MNTETQESLFDVIAVNLTTNKVDGIYGQNKTKANAEAIVSMAVMRRWVETHFYTECPSGKYKNGDEYCGK